MLRSKIVCTLGPASDSVEVVGALVREGMDVARFNMSHGTHEEHARTMERVRRAADEMDRPVALLADLQGPKIRVGDLEEPMMLEVGAVVEMAPEGEASHGQVPTTYGDFAQDLYPGASVLLDDGAIELASLDVDGRWARLQVIRGGILESHKGINMPGVKIGDAPLTEKDEKDLSFALSEGVDFIGQSFIREPSDVSAVRERVGGRALLVAKIERGNALESLDEILSRADAVMVARGDLGVELPFEKVPLAQKWIIQRANAWNRPVITATQMLESMVVSPRPTRAEASDVANALLDGTDSVMLSGETAIGRHPVLALQAIVRISREIQRSGLLDHGPKYDMEMEGPQHLGATPTEHALAAATLESVRQVGAPAVVVVTRSGFSARLISSYRPPVPIFAVCTDPRVHRQLAAVWGVRPVLSREEEVSYEGLTDFGCRMVAEDGVGEPGDSVVITAGVPFHVSGTTNTLRVRPL